VAADGLINPQVADVEPLPVRVTVGAADNAVPGAEKNAERLAVRLLGPGPVVCDQAGYQLAHMPGIRVALHDELE
jgi:hypothetical protein